LAETNSVLSINRARFAEMREAPIRLPPSRPFAISVDQMHLREPARIQPDWTTARLSRSRCRTTN